jgi:hypothetical protein
MGFGLTQDRNGRDDRSQNQDEEDRHKNQILEHDKEKSRGKQLLHAFMGPEPSAGVVARGQIRLVAPV